MVPFGGMKDGECGGALVESETEDDLENGSADGAEDKAGQSAPEEDRGESSSPPCSSAVQVSTHYALSASGVKTNIQLMYGFLGLVRVP